jgi:hypothetical protein
MFPIFEPVMLMFQPIVTGLATLAAAAVGGIVAVVGLVAIDRRTRRGAPRAGARILRLPEAA